MTPEQLTALKEELERFLQHPLNLEYHLMGQSKHTSAFYLPLPNNPDNDFSAAPFPNDFLRDREIPRVYAFRAILLQRLKDALAVEGWGHAYGSIDGREMWVRNSDKYWMLLPRGDDPEVLRLLRAINQSEVFQ